MQLCVHQNALGAWMLGTWDRVTKGGRLAELSALLRIWGPKGCSPGWRTKADRGQHGGQRTFPRNKQRRQDHWSRCLQQHM